MCYVVESIPIHAVVNITILIDEPYSLTNYFPFMIGVILCSCLVESVGKSLHGVFGRVCFLASAPDHIRMRVWERGAGVTAACGTGASATLVAAVRKGLSNREAKIEMDGGTLTISWTWEGDVLMTGDTNMAFEGTAFL